MVAKLTKNLHHMKGEILRYSNHNDKHYSLFKAICGPNLMQKYNKINWMYEKQVKRIKFQLEHILAKTEVVGPNSLARSIFY